MIIYQSSYENLSKVAFFFELHFAICLMFSHILIAQQNFALSQLISLGKRENNQCNWGAFTKPVTLISEIMNNYDLVKITQIILQNHKYLCDLIDEYFFMLQSFYPQLKTKP